MIEAAQLSGLGGQVARASTSSEAEPSGAVAGAGATSAAVASTEAEGSSRSLSLEQRPAANWQGKGKTRANGPRGRTAPLDRRKLPLNSSEDPSPAPRTEGQDQCPTSTIEEEQILNSDESPSSTKALDEEASIETKDAGVQQEPESPGAELYRKLRDALRWQMRSTGAGSDLQKRAKFRATAARESVSDVYHYWKLKSADDVFDASLHLKVATCLGLLCFRGSKLPVETDDADLLRKEAGAHIFDILNVAKESGLEGKDLLFRCQNLEIQALELTGDAELARSRLISILEQPERRLPLLASAMSSNEHRPRQVSVRARAYADERRAGLEPLSVTLASILQGMHVHARQGAKDPQEVEQRIRQSLEWLFDHVETLGLIRYGFDKASVSFKHLVSLIHEPLDMCKSILSAQSTEGAEWKATKAAPAFSAIARTLVTMNAHMDACDVYRWCTSQGIRLPETVGRRIVRVLSLKKEYVLAERIASELHKQAPTSPQGRVLERSTLKVLIKLYAQQGHESKMEEEIRRFVDNLYAPAQEYFMGKDAMPRGSHDQFFRKNRLMCWAIRGDVEKCKDMLLRHYDVRRFLKVNASQYHRAKRVGLQEVDSSILRRLLQAYINRGLLADAEELWDRMSSCPPHLRHLRPDSNMFNSLLAAYVLRNDLGAAASLWEQMRERSNFRPTRASFTTMMNLSAERQDVEGAKKMLETMIHEYGHEPDREALTALMDAHVEAGSWQGALDVFEWMQTQSSLGLRPSTGAYNTLIKIDVLRGAPARSVMAVLSHMLSAGIVPDERTYALVMQAACDSGLMDQAEDIFEMADRSLLSQTGVFGEGCNAYHFTIIIHAYHRLGLPQEAKEYLDEMQRRGVEPTAITWSSFVKMYAERASDDPSSWQSALDFVRQLASNFQPLSSSSDLGGDAAKEGGTPGARRFAPKQGDQLLDLYDPLIHSAAKQGEPRKVETLIRELVDQGTSIPLRVWTSLLDAFRRRSDAAGCLQVWSNLLEQAREENEAAASMLKRGRGRGSWRAQNLVCVPLSILIDALTTAGKYEAVVEAWTDVKAAGFTFDAHNWNHLCVALVRGGWIGQALDIVEEVLYDPPPISSNSVTSSSTLSLEEEEKEEKPVAARSTDWVQKLVYGDGQGTQGVLQDDSSEKEDEEEEREGMDSELEHLTESDDELGRQEDEGERPAQRDEESGPASDRGTTEWEIDREDPRGWAARRIRRQRQTQIRHDFSFSIDPSIVDDSARMKSDSWDEGESASSRRSGSALNRFAYDLSSSITPSSPWFAHYNTLLTLYDSVNQRLAASRRQNATLYPPTLDLASDIGGQSHEESIGAAMVEQLRRHPKARSLLADFSKRLEAIREKERLESQNYS